MAKKIRKFEIGQNVPNLHNFYLAFSASSQHSHKTTKIYLGLIFLYVVFHPLEYLCNYILSPTKLSFVCNHPRKVHYICYSVCTLNFAISVCKNCRRNPRNDLKMKTGICLFSTRNMAKFSEQTE